MADNSARISAIQAILQQGASRVQVDGTDVEYDLGALRAELRQLQLSDDTQRKRRPVISSIDLSKPN